MKQRVKLTESDLHRIITESVKRVLSEGAKDVDPNNVVPQMVAEKYGFEPEYQGLKNGLELWCKYDSNPRKLLSRLMIDRFTSWSRVNGENMYKLRITVKPDPKGNMGNYVPMGYSNEKGELFHNPKNGHVKVEPDNFQKR